MMIVPNAVVVVAVAAEETPLPRVEIAFPPSSFVVYREVLFVVVVVIIFTRDNEKSSEVFFVRLKKTRAFVWQPPN